MIKVTYYCGTAPAGKLVLEKLVSLLDQDKASVEIVDLSQLPSRIDEAEKAGVHTLPALVVDGQVFHVNHGMTVEELKHIELDEEPLYPTEKDNVREMEEADYY